MDDPKQVSTGGWRFALRALESRNYRLFFGGQLVSLVGTFLTQAATAWLVFRLAKHSAYPQRAAVLLGTVGFAGQIPLFVLAPFAGVWVDRLDKRKLLIVTQILAMLQSLALAIMAFTWIRIPLIVALALIQGLINAFDVPARQAFILDMMERKEDLPNAVALNSAMLHTARIVGPSLAGLLIPFIGEGFCFLIDGISYIGVIAALVAMTVKSMPRNGNARSVLHDLHEGLTYVWNFMPIRVLLILTAILSFTVTPGINVLMPIYGDALSGKLAGATTMGLLIGGSGVGAVIATIYLATRRSIIGLGRIIAMASGAYGLAAIAFAFSNTLWLSLIIIPITGFAMISTLVPVSTLIQVLAAEDKRGRVMSFYTMAFGMMPFGSLFIGWLAVRFGAGVNGAHRALILAGLLCFLASIAFALVLPQLRKVIRPIYVTLGHLPAVEQSTMVGAEGEVMVSSLQTENVGDGTSAEQLISRGNVSVFTPLTHRQRQEEWMDRPDVDPEHLRKSLLFIRQINRFLGYTRVTLDHLDRFSSTWDRSKPITILDVATGSADIPLAILKWAQEKHFNVNVTGVDLHAKTAHFATSKALGRSASNGLAIVQADAMHLPFADQSFDYTLTHMFLHHLDEPQIVHVMKELDRVSRRGVIISDLLRHRRALAWIKLFTFAANPVVKHDAAVSIAQAFSRQEVLDLRDRAGLNYARYAEHFGHRFSLAGTKAASAGSDG